MSTATRKQREFERRGQEILDAALALCSAPDWESVSVEQIAERAEIGKGTVYKHFSSKDELLFRLTLRFYQGLLDELRNLTLGKDPKATFEAAARRALGYHAEHREYRYVVEYCDRSDFKEKADPRWRDEFLALDQQFQDWGGPLVQAGMDAGAFERRPVEEVMLGMHACFQGAVTMLWSADNWCMSADDETVIRAATAFMMAGLVGRQSTPAPGRTTVPVRRPPRLRRTMEISTQGDD